MIFNLARNGVDEIAIFIITPIPGSSIYDQITGFKNYSELNFSPTWRDDYAKLFKVRLMYYAYFIILKTSFNQRRKKLKNSLSKINFHLEKENNIFDKRPEQLSLEEFIFLSQNIKNEI